MHQFSSPDTSNPITTSPQAKKYWVQVPWNLICELLKVIHVIFGIYKSNSFPAECILPEDWDQGNRGRDRVAHLGKTQQQHEFSIQFQSLPEQGFHQNQVAQSPIWPGFEAEIYILVIYPPSCTLVYVHEENKKIRMYFHEILAFWAAPCGSSVQGSSPPPGTVLFLVRQTHQFQ